MKQMESRVQQAVQDYRWARSALCKLGVVEPMFHDITKEDLKMPGDIVEENRFGQQSDKLAWFWRLDFNVEGEEQSDRMKECKWQIINIH